MPPPAMISEEMTEAAADGLAIANDWREDGRAEKRARVAEVL